MSNLTTGPFTPKLFMPLSLFSILMSATIIGLAVVNFGFLSIWLNMSIAILTIIFHVTSLFLVWREQQRVLVESSLPSTPSLSSSIGEKTPPSTTTECQKNAPLELPVASCATSFGLLIFLLVVYAVASFVTISITLNGNGGVNSTLPSERATGMTWPWNIHVQIAQSAMLGAETLVMAVIAALCAKARWKFGRLEREKRDEEHYYGTEAPSEVMNPVLV